MSVFIAAVQMILDSLDDIYCLQESEPEERAHLLALLEDAHLHVLLEVSLNNLLIVVKFL